MLVGNKEPFSLNLTWVGCNVWVMLRWMLGHSGLALCPGTWLLIGFQQSNWFSVLKSLLFSLGNEASKLQRQKKRNLNACSWICASSSTWYYHGINFWCAPLKRENAKQSNPWLSIQWEMSVLEWTINISEKYSMFINLYRFTAPKWADQTGKMEVLTAYFEFPGSELILCHFNLLNRSGSLEVQWTLISYLYMLLSLEINVPQIIKK